MLCLYNTTTTTNMASNSPKQNEMTAVAALLEINDRRQTEKRKRSETVSSVTSDNSSASDSRKPGSSVSSPKGAKRLRKTRAARKEASPVYPMAPKVVLVCKGPKSHVDHTYRDFSTMPIEAEYIDPILSPGIALKHVPFARLLHLLLTAEDGKGAIAWRPHGRAFVIVTPSKLEQDKVLLKYFDHNRYSSFLSQLKNYGLKSITQGKDKGCFYHECFLRGLPYLTKYMPDTKDTRRLICDPKNEPDFYTISAIWPVPSNDNMPFVQNNSSKASLDNMHTTAAAVGSSSQQQPLRPIGSSRSRGNASGSTDGAAISAGLTQALITLLGQKLKQPELQQESQSMASMNNAYVPPVPLQSNSSMLSPAVPQINNQSLQDIGLNVLLGASQNPLATNNNNSVLNQLVSAIQQQAQAVVALPPVPLIDNALQELQVMREVQSRLDNSALSLLLNMTSNSSQSAVAAVPQHYHQLQQHISPRQVTFPSPRNNESNQQEPLSQATVEQLLSNILSRSLK